MNQQVLIVEGVHDYNKIKSIYPNLNIITTNGSDVSEPLLETLMEIAKNNQLIIFTDPDGPGEKIRKTIGNRIPSAKHVFIQKEKAKGKGKIGVEHANKKELIKILDDIQNIKRHRTLIFNKRELNLLGVIGLQNSKQIRLEVLNQLNLGYVNAKGFNERISMSTLKKEKLIELINHIRSKYE